MVHRKWKGEAIHSLRQPNYSPQKLQLIHTGVLSGLSVLISVIGLVLSIVSSKMGTGLQDMGKRNLVDTVQLMLPLLLLIVQPFWNVGLQNAAIEYADQKRVKPKSLLGGFPRWKPILTSSLMIGLLYMARVYIAGFLASQVISFTPFAKTVLNASNQLMENPEADLFALLGDQAVPFLVTFGSVFFAIFVAMALPLYYRNRFVNYILLENPGMGGLKAMFISRAMTHGRRKTLFKLDLSFWWFYALETLATAVCYGDIILQALNVPLPMSETVASWAFLVLGLGLQLLVHCLAKPYLEVSWVKAYRGCAVPQIIPQFFRQNFVDADQDV